MKSKQTTYLMIVAVILAILYFFRDSIFKGKGDDAENLNETVDQSTSEDTLNNAQADESQPQSDFNTVVGKNSSKHSTVLKVQKLMNSAIWEAGHTGMNNADVDPDPKIEEYSQKIMALGFVKQDGKFGSKTEAAAKIICGKKSVSPNDVYKKAKSWHLRNNNI